MNSVATFATAGTIYFDVYAGLTQTNTSHTDDGINLCYASFLSSGTSRSANSTLSMTLTNGFNTATGTGPGTSQDLNRDGNKDLGSTNASSATGWGPLARLLGRGLRGPGRG